MARRSHNPHRAILFSSASDPSVDTPLCRLNANDEATMLRAGHIRLIPGPYLPDQPRRYMKTYLDRIPSRSHYDRPAAGSFNDAWQTQQSGYAGPLVMQMRPTRYVHDEVPA